MESNLSFSFLRSMSEPEVQATITLILRRRQILCLLLRGHSIPNLIALLVPPDVVQLRARVENAQVDAGDGDEDTVSASVPRCVVLTIDIRHDD